MATPAAAIIRASLTGRPAERPAPTYRLSVYDVADNPNDSGRWETQAEGVRLFALRALIRHFEARSYDRQGSILVERE